MNVVLLRVGIDTGYGGIHSPIFADGSFEFIPIPDKSGFDERTYGNTLGRHNRAFSDYFPISRRSEVSSAAMHVDPEFESFTYGDPTTPKRGLAKLAAGDLLVFYAGMKGWDHPRDPALYFVGYFCVEFAGLAGTLTADQIADCCNNYHVRHPSVFADQRERLVLVKGTKDSRLFTTAHLLGETVRRVNGTSWQLITPSMENVFGRFGGIGSLQRSTPRWVGQPLASSAAEFVQSLS